VPSQAGTEVKAVIDLAVSGTPAAIEAFADREDLLPE
jgi:hypothetical protein